MNYAFRKLPVEIQAFQMTKDRADTNIDWPVWLHTAWNADSDEPGSMEIVSDTERQFEIVTLEGNHLVTWGDWIIQGVNGEIYPCKPDIFEKTYEAVK